jgi:diphthamide synthase (EF-2-diphthine--ammonia ligase)
MLSRDFSNFVSMKEKALVLWSGGKDCNLALQLAKDKGYEIIALATFHSKSTEFRAHSRELMELQSKSLGIPHLLLEIQEPFAENYEKIERSIGDYNRGFRRYFGSTWKFELDF